LSFLLSKKNPKTLAEAHNMAIQIEKNLSLTRANAMDILGLIKLVSHENFEDTQEGGEQVSNQQNEDMDEEQEPEKMMKCPPLLLLLMKSCKKLSLLCSKAKMRLVIFHFKILMILCYLIQKKKRK
jgi:hypothetical protein